MFLKPTSNSCGVATLIAPNTSIEIHSTTLDQCGRLIALECNLNGNLYVLCNVYAPTVDKAMDQAIFGQFLYNTIERFFGESVILGGDLNCNIEHLQNNLYKQKQSYSSYLQQMVETLDLVDIWKVKNPGVHKFTRRQNTRNGLIHSRIDFFLVTSHLEYVVQKADILPGLKSDHSLLELSLFVENQPKRGRGLWKLNTSLLQDSDYIKLIKSTISDAKLDLANLSDKHMDWDYVKCRIRTESISFSIKKNKKQHKYINSLTQRLTYLEGQISTTPSPLELEEYETINSEVEEYYEQKARGTFVRSRCKFVNEYEKPSKYFLNLEKTRQKKLQINALNIDGKRIFNPFHILEAQKNFYSKLFSNSENDPDTTEIDNYLNSVNFPKVSNDAMEVCDKEISMNELEKSVKELHNNKAPGPDGLPGEFYKIFWNDISDLVSKSFQDAFKNGSLSKTQKQGVLCLIPKKGKDLTKLESWRPLSLLNTDYKILAKVLAKRLKSALLEIINPDQMGYIFSMAKTLD